MGGVISDVGSALGFGGGSTTTLNKAGMDVTPEALAAEREAIQRNRDIAAGNTKSVSELEYQQNLADLARQQMALAAGQRGVSNAALGFRTAQEMGQQAGAESAGKEALMTAEERQMADKANMALAAGQRGVALGAGNAEMQARQQKRTQGLGIVGNLGNILGGSSLTGVGGGQNG